MALGELEKHVVQESSSRAHIVPPGQAGVSSHVMTSFHETKMTAARQDVDDRSVYISGRGPMPSLVDALCGGVGTSRSGSCTKS